jgi:hypothetical protein
MYNWRYSFSDLDTYWNGFEALDLATVQCFGVSCWIRHKNCTWAPTFNGSH